MFGNLLKELRKKHSLSQNELAARFNKRSATTKFKLNNPILSRYENSDYNLSREKFREILLYGFNYTIEEANTLVAKHELRSIYSNMTPQERMQFKKEAAEEIRILDKSAQLEDIEFLQEFKLQDNFKKVPFYSDLPSALEGKKKSILHENDQPVPTGSSIDYKKSFAIEAHENIEDIQSGSILIIERNPHKIKNGDLCAIQMSTQVFFGKIFREENKKKYSIMTTTNELKVLSKKEMINFGVIRYIGKIIK